ncbi:4-aminobutyrate--2-oxoglutarate transaminase [Desulfococcus sp.]|uniref:4-aminobutyrate--2-oxoglutarate transaminase n=1 Tax=Desulfococcus sp. TaxID=2025834 RepID=UPI003593A48D
MSTNGALHESRNKVIAKGNVSGTGTYIAKARGARLTDVEGREYIDFGGGIAVMNVGHSHPKVVAAIQRQAERFTHTCFMVTPYESPVRLAEKLCAAVPGDFPKSAMFANSGAEAVENAVKIARYATQKPAVIAFENAFHGRTLLAMTLTSKVKPYKFGFGPFAPEIYRMPFAYCYRCPFRLSYPACDVACADYFNDFLITHVVPENTAAIIFEPVQGEGGFIVPPKEYFPRIKATCEANGILFIADEIQTGMGRTGTLFGMEQFGVVADITTVAKSLAAGMPLSAVVGRKEIMDSVHASGIGGTYGGNPLACEAALAVFDIFETEGLLTKAKALGEILRTRLNAFKESCALVGDVRGLGPMMAMELVKDREKKTPAADEAKALTRFCLDRGLVLLSCGIYGNVIRFLMPLVISDADLNTGLDIVGEGLEAVSRS